MHKKPMPPKPRPFVSISTVLAIVLLWSLAGCTTPPAPLPPEPVRSVQIPPLPTWARQPATQSVCSPTCSDALTKERESWRQSLMKAGSVGSPASAPTTPPAKP